MSGISATSMAGMQQAWQMIDKASARVSEAASGGQSDDLTNAVVDVDSAKIQMQANVNSFEAGDTIMQSVLDLFV